MKPSEEKIQAMIQVNPFVQMLAQLRDGAFITECTDLIGVTLAAVKRNGQKAELKITLTILPDGKGEVRNVDILGEAKAKLPERKKKATTFFLVGEQSLSRTGTSEQADFDFEVKQAPATPAPVTKMPAKTAAQ